jgi:hypothetical protein
VTGLALVWGLVWANLPSKEEMLADMPVVRPAAPPAMPELDLTIPVSPPVPPAVLSQQPAATAVPEGIRARQIVELKCEAEIERICPEGAAGREHHQCVELRIAQMSPPCQEIARRQAVKWKVAADYQSACLEDMATSCPGMKPGDERLVPCLQRHAQALSDRCYQSLPKGTLHYNR